MQMLDHPYGDYRFATGIAPYSAGVIAQPGFMLNRVQFAAPVPLAAGFDRIAAYLAAQGRPRQSLCAMELRIPAPLPFDGFGALNREYRAVLDDWGILVGDHNPVARTNVAPAAGAPAEPTVYAFTYTTPIAPAVSRATFIVAGAGDLRDQADLRPEAIVRPGETSPAALLEKGEVVLSVMHDRLTAIGATWPQVTDTNLYTIHPVAHFWDSLLLPKLGALALHGVHWYYSHPPIAGLEFEMDLRHVGTNTLLA